MDKNNVIKQLSLFHGVSGYEYRFSGEIARMFSQYCSEVSVDNLGSVTGVIRSGKSDAKAVMIEAHMDEIGMMITEIDDRGFLRFTNVGGIDARILPGKEVVVHGKNDLVGIIGAKPPHITTSEMRSKAIPMTELYIDIGYGKDKAEEYVSVGDTVTFADGYRELGTEYISTKSQDDRTSVAVMLFVMEKLKNYILPFDVYFCACVQEEVGRRGAGVLATNVDPVFAVAIDVCHATTPDASADTVKAGSGTVISQGPNIHPVLFDHAVQVMKENNVPFTVEIESDDTGTDAWAIQTAKEGIPTLLFSLPLKYMHTMVETVNINDVNQTANAIFALLTNTEDAEAAVCYN